MVVRSYSRSPCTKDDCGGWVRRPAVTLNSLTLAALHPRASKSTVSTLYAIRSMQQQVFEKENATWGEGNPTVYLSPNDNYMATSPLPESRAGIHTAAEPASGSLEGADAVWWLDARAVQYPPSYPEFGLVTVRCRLLATSLHRAKRAPAWKAMPVAVGAFPLRRSMARAA